MVTIRDADPELPALSAAVTRNVTVPVHLSGTFQVHVPVSEVEVRIKIQELPPSREYSTLTDEILLVSFIDQLICTVSLGE